MSQKTGEELAEADTDGKVNLEADTNNEDGDDIDVLENEDATTTKPDLDEVLNKSEDTADRDVANESEEAEEQTDTPEEAEREVE
jgi:hypothetical protein